MDRETYLETRRKILAEAQATLDALDRVYAYLKDDGNKRDDSANLSGADSLETAQSQLVPLEYERGGGPAPNGDARKVGVTQAVREAVDEVEGSFTQQRITGIAVERYPHVGIRPASVANVLHRMAKRGSIKLVRKGYGSAPNAYQKSDKWSVEHQIAEGIPPEEAESD